MEKISPKICVIGVGNVGSHLALALSEIGWVCQILCRHKEHAVDVCASLPKCEVIDNPADLVADADYYIIAVNDDHVAEVINSTPNYSGIWAHTSGSVPMTVFEGKKSHYGVFYPLQTFTRGVEVCVEEVPFLIEGNGDDVTKSLLCLARKVSHTVERADSSRRKTMHLAAVFACNFANLMWLEADEILHREGLSVKFLVPLLKATLGKLNDISPADAMTGPARRGDRAVIQSHLEMLEGERRAEYEMLSNRILKKFADK